MVCFNIRSDLKTLRTQDLASLRLKQKNGIQLILAIDRISMFNINRVYGDTVKYSIIYSINPLISSNVLCFGCLEIEYITQIVIVYEGALASLHL